MKILSTTLSIVIELFAILAERVVPLEEQNCVQTLYKFITSLQHVANFDCILIPPSTRFLKANWDKIKILTTNLGIN